MKTSPIELQLETALPGKLSGPYTELPASFEIVPGNVMKARRKSLSAQYAELINLRKAVEQAMRDYEVDPHAKGYVTRLQ